MRSRTILLLAGAAVAAMSSLPALAGDCPSTCAGGAPPSPPAAIILNDQEQLGAVFGSMGLTVETAPQASGSATAAGNTLTGTVTSGPLQVESAQRMYGTTGAKADLYANGATVATASAAATGSGLTASAGGSVTASATQETHADSTAAATAVVKNAGDAAIGANAGGNVAALSGRDGAVNAYVGQTMGGATVATVDAEVCCAATASAAAVASGNDITVSAENAAMAVHTSQANNGPETRAYVDLYVGGAQVAAGSATAAGNSLSLSSSRYYGEGAGYQGNVSAVKSEAYVTSGGQVLNGGASASGVGNQIVAQNRGADLNLSYEQRNLGSVQAYGHYVSAGGVPGGVGAASATAIGNSITGVVCTQCGPGALTARSTQYNAGAVTAGALVSVGAGMSGVAAATAVGNAATYHVGPMD